MLLRVRCFFAITAVCALAVSFAAAPPARAQVVIPGVLEGREGITGLTTPLNGAPRTLLLSFSDVALNGLAPGTLITGISFRHNAGNATARPLVDLTFADYEIYVGRENLAASGSTVFADYFLPGSRTLVRDGALTVPAGSYGVVPGSVPQPFGPAITFNVSPFLYTGSGLVLLIQHTGNGLENVAADSEGNIGGAFAMSASAFGATEGTGFPSIPVVNLLVINAVAPEPGTLALLAMAAGGIGTIAFARRRRRK
jgi:hypothetical protein